MLLKKALSLPAVYDRFQTAVGGVRGRKFYVENHVKPKQGQKVLDIGCGTGEMRKLFPEVEYHGFDPSQYYINKANSSGYKNSTFTCGLLTEANLQKPAYFDIGHSSGVLHHLTDDQALELLRVAKKALKPGCKYYTFDGCFYPGQSLLSVITLKLDRGKFMRNEQGYKTMASSVFGNVKTYLYPSLFKTIPYPSLIMEMWD